jgi:hypothetical protein
MRNIKIMVLSLAMLSITVPAAMADEISYPKLESREIQTFNKRLFNLAKAATPCDMLFFTSSRRLVWKEPIKFKEIRDSPIFNMLNSPPNIYFGAGGEIACHCSGQIDSICLRKILE